MSDGGCCDVTLIIEPSNKNKRNPIMDLTTWLPAMFLLGLALFALMFACVPACDNV